MADTDVDIRVSFGDRFKKKSSFIFDLFYPGVLSMWRERKKESQKMEGGSERVEKEDFMNDCLKEIVTFELDLVKKTS